MAVDEQVRGLLQPWLERLARRADEAGVRPLQLTLLGLVLGVVLGVLLGVLLGVVLGLVLGLVPSRLDGPLGPSPSSSCTLVIATSLGSTSLPSELAMAVM